MFHDCKKDGILNFTNNFKPSNLKSMTKKIMLIVSSLTKFNKTKLVMRLITMVLLFGTIQTFAASSMLDEGIVTNDDLQQKAVTGRLSILTVTV